MEGKITLITPPDFYENGNLSILLLSISDSQQEQTGSYLKNTTIKSDLNIYTYLGENNMQWLLYAVSRADYKFINIDTQDSITNIMSSYILTRPNVYYSCSNDDHAHILGYINNNRVENIGQFFERIFSE